MLLALALRVYRLGVHELWFDETWSFHEATAEHWLARLPLSDVPPLYVVLLHHWMGVVGTAEAALRLLSALFGTLAVAATMWSAREIGGPRAVVPAGLAAAVAPMHVYYSQEARSYAFLLFLLAALLGLVHRAVRRDRAWDWVLVSVVATLVLYTHYLGTLALIGTAGMLLEASRPRVVLRWTAALVAAGLLFVPWLVASFVLVAHYLGGADWIADVWARTPPSRAIARSLELFVIGPQAGLLPITLKQFTTLAFPEPLRWLALGAATTLGLALVAPLGAGGTVPASGRRVAALLVAILFPLAALFTVSWVKPIYVPGRYDMLAFPAFSLLVGLAWARLGAAGPRARRIAPVLAVALAIPVAVKLVGYYAQPAERSGASAATAAFLAARLARDDVVILPFHRGHLVLYQLSRRGWRWRGDACEDTRTGTASSATSSRCQPSSGRTPASPTRCVRPSSRHSAPIRRASSSCSAGGPSAPRDPEFCPTTRPWWESCSAWGTGSSQVIGRSASRSIGDFEHRVARAAGRSPATPAFRVCRAGFAARGTPSARATAAELSPSRAETKSRL